MRLKVEADAAVARAVEAAAEAAALQAQVTDLTITLDTVKAVLLPSTKENLSQ